MAHKVINTKKHTVRRIIHSILTVCGRILMTMTLLLGVTPVIMLHRERHFTDVIKVTKSIDLTLRKIAEWA